MPDQNSKLRKYINSKLLGVLLERKQHTDDEIVDFNEIDLREEFDKLNALLFDNKVQPVHLKWDNRKSSHGHVKATRERGTNEFQVQYLSMSQFLSVPYKIFKSTLAHEMIHVYLFQKGINDGHGYKFKSEMMRINHLNLGFNVQVRSSGEFEIASHIKNKRENANKHFVVVVGEVDLKKNLVAVMSPEVFQKEGEKIKNLYERLVKAGKIRHVKFEFYKSKNIELFNYRQQRSFDSRFKYAFSTEEFINTLKSEGEFITSFELP